MGCSNSQSINPSLTIDNNHNTILSLKDPSTNFTTYQHRQQRPKRSMKLSKRTPLHTKLPPIYEDNNNNLSATHQSFSYIHPKQIHNTTIPITTTTSSTIVGHNKNNNSMISNMTVRQSSNTHSFSKRLSQSDIRRSECNGVVIVENIRKHLPKEINEQMIYELVANSLEGCVIEESNDNNTEQCVDKMGNKMVTQEQVKAIAEVVYDKLVDGDNVKRKKKSSIINGLNVRVGIRKLTPSLLKKTCFKGQNVTKMQIDNALKNISQGEENVRILTVEIN